MEVEQGDGWVHFGGTLGCTPCSALVLLVLKPGLDWVGGVSADELHPPRATAGLNQCKIIM